jgi:hypothetical protein
MAINVAKIKKSIGATSKIDALKNEAEKQAFVGNMNKAVELYHMAAFNAIKSGSNIKSTKIFIAKQMATNITEIGGVTSKQLLDYIEKNQ